MTQMTAPTQAKRLLDPLLPRHSSSEILNFHSGLGVAYWRYCLKSVAASGGTARARAKLGRQQNRKAMSVFGITGNAALPVAAASFV